MSARAALILIAALLAGLLAALGKRPEPSHREPAPLPEAPIVAIRGQPLVEFEEPLPPGARVRIGSTRYRHPDRLGHSDVHDAGRYFVVRRAGSFELIEMATGRRIWTQPIPDSNGADWTRNLAASRDGRIVVWNAGCGRQTAEFGQVWKVTDDPASPVQLVTSLWPPEREEQNFTDGVYLPEDPRQVWTIGFDGVRMFDADSGRQIQHIKTKLGVLDMDRHGTRVLASDNCVAGGPWDFCKWGMNMRYRFRPKTIPDPPPSAARPKRHLPGRLVRSPDANLTSVNLHVLDTRTGEQVFATTVLYERQGRLAHLGLSPDGRYMSCEADDCLTVFDIDRRSEVLRLDTWEGDERQRSRLVSEAWFSDDGRGLTVAGPDIDTTEFDLTSGEFLPTPDCKPPLPAMFTATRVPGDLLSPDGVLRSPIGQPLPAGYAGVTIGYEPVRRLIAVGDATGRLDVWRESGRLVRTIRSAGPGITARAFSPDGDRLVGCDRNRVVRAWTTDDWREYDRFDVPVDHDFRDLCPDRLVFGPGGGQLLVSRADVVALWDFETRSWLWDLPGQSIKAGWPPPAFTADGLAVITPGEEHWIIARTGEAGAEIPGLPRSDQEQVVRWRERHDEEIGPAAPPDGTRVARIDETGLLTVAILGTGRVRTFPESPMVAKLHPSLRFSPDGRRLVTCDDAGHAHVWEVASGQLAFTLTYPDGAIHDVRFTADGRSLITANHREVIVWDLALSAPVADPWADLGHEAPRAEQARRALLADPEKAVELLTSRLRPVKPIDPAAVGELVRGLDHARFRQREQAAADLWALGRRVLPLLREAKPASAEGRTRLAAIVEQLAAGSTADEQRQIRSVEVLEQINSPAARRLIDELAAGDSAAVLTEEAAKTRGRRRRSEARRFP
jgi:WD40 repeat protein